MHKIDVWITLVFFAPFNLIRVGGADKDAIIEPRGSSSSSSPSESLWVLPNKAFSFYLNHKIKYVQWALSLIHSMFSEHWALYKVCSVSIEPYTKYVQRALSLIQSMFSEHWALYKVRSVSIEPYTKYVQRALSLIIDLHTKQNTDTESQN